MKSTVSLTELRDERSKMKFALLKARITMLLYFGAGASVLGLLGFVVYWFFSQSPSTITGTIELDDKLSALVTDAQENVKVNCLPSDSCNLEIMYWQNGSMDPTKIYIEKIKPVYEKQPGAHYNMEVREISDNHVLIYGTLSEYTYVIGSVLVGVLIVLTIACIGWGLDEKKKADGYKKDLHAISEIISMKSVVS